MKRLVPGFLLVCFCLLGFVSAVWADEGISQKVMIITVDDAVEPGLASYLERNVGIAQQEQVDLIILELDTPGGRVDAAQDIKRILYGSKIETVALLKDQALAAGA